MGNFILFMRSVSDELRENGNFGTAHVYRSSLNAIVAFGKSSYLPFKKVTPKFLKDFESHLRGKNCSWNTVSTYMRTLRAVYNRAVDRRLAPYVPHLFKYVYTGTRADKKRALETDDMKRLMHALPEGLQGEDKELQRARGYFILMFLLRGIPFVDLAFLKRQDIDGNVLTYRRRKTGRMLTVTLLPEAKQLIRKYANADAESPYLFPLVSADDGTEKAYREYQLSLRHFNYQLEVLRQLLGFSIGLSSYTARHTWATMAYYREVHPGVISEAMGHSSIVVTETYLKPFKNKKIDEANGLVFSPLRRSFSMGN